jgi:hypothetical protein
MPLDALAPLPSSDHSHLDQGRPSIPNIQESPECAAKIAVQTSSCCD